MAASSAPCPNRSRPNPTTVTIVATTTGPSTIHSSVRRPWRARTRPPATAAGGSTTSQTRLPAVRVPAWRPSVSADSGDQKPQVRHHAEVQRALPAHEGGRTDQGTEEEQRAARGAAEHRQRDQQDGEHDGTRQRLRHERAVCRDERGVDRTESSGDQTGTPTRHATGEQAEEQDDDAADEGPDEPVAELRLLPER